MKNKFWAITAILIFLGIEVSALLLKVKATAFPNILLIAVNSLRPDRLGCYGSQEDTFFR